MMRTNRYASVWLPDWPAQRLARQPRSAPPEPFVVAHTTRQKRLVHAVSLEAAKAGLRAGSTVALAQARVAGLEVIEADLTEDEASLRRLALWALRYSPLVAIEGPDGFVLDTGGAAHLHGGEEALLQDLLKRLKAAGLQGRAAMSSSRLLSAAMARFSKEADDAFIVPPGKEAAAAAPLPAAALGMDTPTTANLHRLGFDRVGQLFSAPRAGLALRFGTDIVTLLDRIVAREPETLEPLSAPELISETVIFAEPIAHTAGVEKGLARLSETLCARLKAENKGARTIDLRAMRVDGEVSALRVGTSAPCRDAEHICRLFAETLDRIDPGFGIERMVLLAPVTEAITLQQKSTEDERGADVPRLVDRLAARIGSPQVFRMAPTESNVPERSFHPVEALAEPPVIEATKGPRPVQLISPPQKIEVIALLPDHPPARFTWRGVHHRIKRADGPECIFGEWWLSHDEIALTRDYYRVEDERGGRYWLFRARDVAAGSAEWFIHGVFG